MENIENKGLLTRIQDYLDSPKGRILLNYLYSWGAAIVILGALFKLTHIKGANLMLFIGMGTEVLVFFISGFERPFIPEKYSGEEDDVETGRVHGNIIINGVPGSIPAGQTIQTGITAPAAGNAGIVQPGTGSAALQDAVPPVATPTEGILSGSGSMDTATQESIDRIQELSATMERLCRHSEKMEQNSEEMEQLSRNLISINTFYQMHLKSASSQMDNIDKVNEQTKRMVEQIEELNQVYARMVEALKVNTPMGNK